MGPIKHKILAPPLLMHYLAFKKKLYCIVPVTANNIFLIFDTMLNKYLKYWYMLNKLIIWPMFEMMLVKDQSIYNI